MDNNTSNNVSNNTNGTSQNSTSYNTYSTNTDTGSYTNNYAGNTTNSENATNNINYANTANSTYNENTAYNSESPHTSGSEGNNEQDSTFYYARTRYANQYSNQYGGQYENRNTGNYRPTNRTDSLSDRVENINSPYGAANSSAWNNYNKPHTTDTSRSGNTNPYGTGYMNQSQYTGSYGAGSNAGANRGTGYVNQSQYTGSYGAGSNAGANRGTGYVNQSQYTGSYGAGSNAGANRGTGYVNQSQYNSPYGAGYTGGYTNQSTYGNNQYRPQQNSGQYNTNTPYGNTNPYGNQNNYRDVYDLESYYNSPYYRNNRKKNERKTLFLALFAVALIVFGSIGATSLVMSFTASQTAKEIVSLENSIEEKYNIVVKVGDEANTWESGFTIEKMNNEKIISRALGYLDDVLDRLPEGFLDEVMNGYSDGRYLEINITGAMVQIDGNREVLGLTTYNEDKDVIRLNSDIFSWQEYKETVAHELFHVIDFEMNQFNEYSEELRKWRNCNPRNFNYSYDEGQYSDYTTYGESIENVYFVSYYSKEDIYEDRAEIFSYLLATDEDDSLPNSYKSTHVKNKVKLLIDEIDSCFKTAMNSNVYWKRWYN